MPSDTSPEGHHPIHTGIQNHSMSECYPLAVVGYGDKPTLYVVENLAEGTVLATRVCLPYSRPRQSPSADIIRALLLDVHAYGIDNTDYWAKGRPKRTALNTLRL